MKAVQAPRLNPLQKAWLQELGLDRRMLAYYASEPDKAPVQAGPPPQASDIRVRSEAPLNELPRTDKTPPTEGPGQSPRPDATSTRGPLQRVADVLARAPRPRADRREPVPAPPSTGSGDVPQDWESLRSHVMQCQACDLHAGRSQAVFGTGADHAPEWMIIGEAPGSHDDRAGIPFQGKSGVLLRAMLASIGVTEQTPVFYTNLIKCRPLGNRTPNPDEIAACLPYLRRQIALLAPRKILALGELAAQAILGSNQDLEALRGRVHTVHSEAGLAVPVVVTYHPAALLLRPQHKPDAWRDLNLALGGDDTLSATPN